VLRQLSRKLGGLNVELIAHIELLPPALLNELAESLFDFSQLEDLETWLYGKTGPRWFTYRWERMGEKRGRQEGRQQGRLKAVQQSLQKKLGAVEPTAQARLKLLSAAQLQKLAVDLLDFSQPADLERWLKRTAG
jgi:hypothetical protein